MEFSCYAFGMDRRGLDRRGFLQFFGAGVAGIALDQAIPFNRVWSFPKKIVLAKPVVVGSMVPIRLPQRWNVEIGDIISVKDWPSRFVVTEVEPGDIRAYCPDQHILLSGIEAKSDSADQNR